MPIAQLMQHLYTFIKNRNYQNHRVTLGNLHAVGRYYGHSRQEVGYAVHTLHANHKITFNKKYGWLIT